MPSMESRVLSGLGPESPLLGVMKRAMENVLHGGAAIIARNSPPRARLSKLVYTSSLSRSSRVSALSPGSLSTMTVVYPSLCKKTASPSGRRLGPENKIKTVVDFRAVASLPFVAWSNASLIVDAVGAAVDVGRSLNATCSS